MRAIKDAATLTFALSLFSVWWALTWASEKTWLLAGKDQTLMPTSPEQAKENAEAAKENQFSDPEENAPAEPEGEDAG